MRIASLLASGTEIVCALGLEADLVAISHECDHPERVTHRPRVTRARIDDSASPRDIDRQVRARAASGQPLYDLDRDALIDLAPDVIITQSHCAVCAVSLNEVRRLVAETPALGATRIVDLNPDSLSAVLADIRAVGRACAAAERAEAVINGLQQRIDAVASRSRSLDRRHEVVCLEWTAPPMIAGNWMPELLELAGGRCPLGHDAGEHRFLEWPDILGATPDIIVIMPCGFDLERARTEAVRLREVDGWSTQPAVRNGRVYAVDGNAYFNRSGPRLVDSLEILAYIVDPQRCAAPPPGSCARVVD